LLLLLLLLLLVVVMMTLKMAEQRLATFSHYSAAEWLLRWLDDYIALVVITAEAMTPS